MRDDVNVGHATSSVAFNEKKTINPYLEVEGLFRTRRFIHEFSKLVLHLAFRWGDAGTSKGMG